MTFDRLKNQAESIFGRLSACAQAQPRIILFIASVATIVGAIYTINNAAINTDTENMLAEDLSWRVTYSEFKANFPFFADNMFVVVDGKTPDIAEDVAQSLAENLTHDAQHFSRVLHLAEHPFFRQNQFLYLSLPELAKLGDDLSRSQAFISQLTHNPSAANLLTILSNALDHSEEVSGYQFDSVIKQIAAAIDQVTEGDYTPMSWRRVFNGTDTGNNRVMFVVKPVLDFSAILPAEDAIKKLRHEIEGLEALYPGAVNIRISGAAALAHDEMLSVIRGSMKAGLLAFLMVFICLFIGLRSWVLVVSTLITLMVGLTFTATFAVMAVGTLNMISIAFAVLYVGLGVDFAIHICLRYRELTGQTDKPAAINQAVQHVGASIALCALTTAIGFFAFIPTDFKGVAELGLIAGVGMFISLLLSIFLLPALLTLLPKLASSHSNVTATQWPKIITAANAKPILATAGCIWFLASISVAFISFDINPINLNDPNAESVKVVRELASEGQAPTNTISILTDSQASLSAIAKQLRDHISVKEAQTINSMIPELQAEKLAAIDELALLLGEDLELAASKPFDALDMQTSLNNLLNKMSAINTANELKTWTSLIRAIETFEKSISALDDRQRIQKLSALDAKLMGSFSGRIQRLADGFEPHDVSIDNLPPELRQRWISEQGKYRIEAIPAVEITSNQELRAFVNDVKSVVGERATGAAIINVGAADAVQSAFIHAFCYALLLISIILWLLLRSLKEVIVSLFPLLLAGLLTCSVMVLVGLEFNFANVIALPLLLGIGVDSSLHLLHRYKTETSASLGLLQTSTARAVFFSAATTTVSFGNLAFSSHAGTASMGLVLSIGISAVLFCMLLILPAMLLMFVEKIPLAR